MKKGFTLIEIMVTLAIVAVLGATTIPSMIGYVDDVKAKECTITRDEMIKMYEVFKREDGAEISGGKFEQAVKSNWGSSQLCPSKGSYAYVALYDVDTGKKRIEVKCSKHINLELDTLYISAKNIQEQYLDVLNSKDMTPAEKDAWAKDIIGPLAEKYGLAAVTNINQIGNDYLRAYLQTQLGGTWEPLNPEINNLINKNKKLYVNAYIQPKGDVIIYANEIEVDAPKKNRWAATAIYNTEDGYWYKQKVGSTSIYKNLAGLVNTEHSWETIKADLEVNWEKIPI